MGGRRVTEDVRRDTFDAGDPADIGERRQDGLVVDRLSPGAVGENKADPVLLPVDQRGRVGRQLAVLLPALVSSSAAKQPSEENTIAPGEQPRLADAPAGDGKEAQ